MDRTACVNLPVFPVQLLLHRNPDWRNYPVAVVDSDKPQGTILWVNEHARSFRILPGMRYAAGLSLTGRLHAAIVPKKEIDRTAAYLSKRLRSFSPHVEPSVDEPGIFWIDASGLKRLYKSLSKWARSIRAEMIRSDFQATVVVGFSRFGTYAIAKAKQGIVVLRKPEDEQIVAQRVPLDRLCLEPGMRDFLEKLGVKTVGQFINLPSEGIAKRFGWEVHRMHQLASGELRLPLQPEKPRPSAMQRLILDYPEINMMRLMGVIERLLHPLLQMLADQARALVEVQVRFCFDRIGDHTERIRPAAPTMDARQLLDLIRLRLQAVHKLPDGVVEVVLMGRGVAAVPKQRQLLESRPKRDLAAANRALARVRAELGDPAVVRARLRAGHLPEGRFAWELLDSLAAPKPCNMDAGRLIRRIYTRPVRLQQHRPREPDGWTLFGLQQRLVMRVFGPYIISGGWWNRLVHREYYFAETQNGELLWVYDDRIRHRWFLQGRVE